MFPLTPAPGGPRGKGFHCSEGHWQFRAVCEKASSASRQKPGPSRVLAPSLLLKRGCLHSWPGGPPRAPRGLPRGQSEPPTEAQTQRLLLVGPPRLPARCAAELGCSGPGFTRGMVAHGAWMRQGPSGRPSVPHLPPPLVPPKEFGRGPAPRTAPTSALPQGPGTCATSLPRGRPGRRGWPTAWLSVGVRPVPGPTAPP